MSLISIFIALLLGIAGAAGGWYLRHTLLTRQLYTTRRRYEEQQAIHMTLQHEVTNLREKLFEKDHKSAEKRQSDSEWKTLVQEKTELADMLSTTRAKHAREMEALRKQSEKQIQEVQYSRDHESAELRRKLESVLKERDELKDTIQAEETKTAAARKRSEMLERQYNIQRAEIANFKTRVAKLQRRLSASERSREPVEAHDGDAPRREVATDKFKQKSRESSTDRFQQRDPEPAAVDQPVPASAEPTRQYALVEPPPGFPGTIAPGDDSPAPETRVQVDGSDHATAGETVRTPATSTPKSESGVSDGNQTKKFAARKRQPEPVDTPQKSGKKPPKSPRKGDISSTGMRLLEAFEKELRGSKKKPK